MKINILKGELTDISAKTEPLLQISQGCAEIRWLASKMGAKPETVAGLAGMGDIMLTCYGQLSRNRQLGIRLGKGEAILDIVATSSQVGIDDCCFLHTCMPSG